MSDEAGDNADRLEIARRLREPQTLFDGQALIGLCDEAAAEIDRIRAENQRLREMLKMWLADEDSELDCREYAKLVAVTREAVADE